MVLLSLIAVVLALSLLVGAAWWLIRPPSYSVPSLPSHRVDYSDGAPDPEVIAIAQKILGVKFPSTPTAIYVHVTGRATTRTSEAYLRAEISRADFDEMLKLLDLLPRAQMTEPLVLENPWYGPRRGPKLAWWTVSAGNRDYGALFEEPGQIGCILIKYEDGSLWGYVDEARTGP